MLLKKASPRKQAIASENHVKGIYMTKEARMDTRNEICRAHFNIGSDEVSKPSCTYP